MKIVLLTLAYHDLENSRNLYTDLMDELVLHGNSVIVFKPDEARWNGKAKYQKRKGILLYSIPTGRVTKAPLLIKAINLTLLGYRFIWAIRKIIDYKIDVLLYSTPPLNFLYAIRKIKRINKCITYLLLKDIFPQNAVDLGIFPRKDLIWYYYRLKEKKLYQISDHIGCMSKANVKYLLNHNPYIPIKRVHVCPNSISPSFPIPSKKKERVFLETLGIPEAKLYLVYGGNLGKPQGINFIGEALLAIDDIKYVYTIIVGDGTEYDRLQKLIDDNGINQVKLIKELPKNEYLNLLDSMDVGLIFLDYRFTIPNFPSRVLDYFDRSLPVIAATDISTDLGDCIEEHNAGFSCKSNDPLYFRSIVERFLNDPFLIETMGNNARLLLENEFSVNKVAKQILSRLV